MIMKAFLKGKRDVWILENLKKSVTNIIKSLRKSQKRNRTSEGVLFLL